MDEGKRTENCPCREAPYSEHLGLISGLDFDLLLALPVVSDQIIFLFGPL